MINNLNENDLGDMEGTFYSEIFGYDIDVIYDSDIPQEYVEKNIQYLDSLDQDFLVSICAALKRYYEDYKRLYPDLCEFVEGDVLGDYEKEPISILKYIDIGVYKFDIYDTTDENIPVINLEGDCAWSGDKGITIAAKNNQLLYVGPWEDFDVWNSSTDYMFNYATSEKK